MKRSVLYAFSLATLLLAGCAQPSDNDDKDDSGGDSTTTNYKVSIDFPASLMASDSASSNSLASRAVRSAVEVSTSYAYENVKTAIEVLETTASTNALYGTMLLTVIDQNSLSPSATAVTGKSLTLTQTLVDAMKAAMPESAQAEFASAYQELVGQSMPVPDFVYQTSTNVNFDFQVVMSQDLENDDGSVSQIETTFYWTDGLSRTAMVFPDGVMAYDAATDSAYLSSESEDGGMTFEMAAVVDASNADAHGVYLKQSFTMGEDEGSLTVYADDSGGLAKNTFTGASFSGSFTEGFDSTGSVTYQALDFSEGMDDQTTGELSATYSAKLDGAPASFGTAETLF